MTEYNKVILVHCVVGFRVRATELFLFRYTESFYLYTITKAVMSLA